MKRFALGAALSAAAFTALCAFLLRGKHPAVPGTPAAPAAAASPNSRGFLDQYFRSVWEAESGQTQAH